MTSHGVLFNNMLSDVPVEDTRSVRSQRSADDTFDDFDDVRHKRQAEEVNITSDYDVNAFKNDTVNEFLSDFEDLMDPPRSGRIRPLTQYTPFVVMDQHHVSEPVAVARLLKFLCFHRN